MTRCAAHCVAGAGVFLARQGHVAIVTRVGGIEFLRNTRA
jgi:hypothetical protein